MFRKLILYPNGVKSEGKHLSMYLVIDEPTLCYNNRAPIHVDLKFFVLNKITNKYTIIRGNVKLTQILISCLF